MRKQKSRLTDPTSSGHQWAGGWEPGSAGAETVGKGLTRDHMKASCGAFENDTALSVNNKQCIITWRRKGQPTPGFLSRESHGQRSVVGYSPRGHKESDMTEQLTTTIYNKIILKNF